MTKTERKAVARKLAAELKMSIPHCYDVLLWCNDDVERAKAMLLRPVRWAVRG